jgi:hypothetical protein
MPVFDNVDDPGAELGQDLQKDHDQKNADDTASENF